MNDLMNTEISTTGNNNGKSVKKTKKRKRTVIKSPGKTKRKK